MTGNPNFSVIREEIVDHMDDTVEIVDDSQSDLLPEILSHIFVYLPFTDRKRVRLTCRSWYDCSAHPNIIKREKYVFRTNTSVEEIADLMLRSNYSLLNLEFQGVPVKELPADAWKVCGVRIQTLEFYECRWSPETLRNVILYCTNLTSIVIKSKMSCQEVTCPISILCSSNVLHDFIKRGLRRSELRTFAMFNEGVQVPENVLKKVFLLFPGIKHFSTGLDHFEIPFSYLTQGYHTPPAFLRLDLCFNPETRLESLTLNVPMDGKWIETLVQKTERGMRLKKLETILVYRNSKEDSLFDFFKSQRNLKVLKLVIAETNADEHKQLFFHILDNCPNLQEFIFQTEKRRMLLEPSELPRFIACTRKLKFLSAVFDVDNGTSTPLYHDLQANPAQLNLTSLRWCCRNIAFTNAVLQRCPSLLHLHFDGVCYDSTLQIIFQFLVELRTLVLYNIQLSRSDYGFTGRTFDRREEGYSIKRLQKLKYLRLQLARHHVAEKSILELQLPRLEFLWLTGTWLTNVRSEEALDHFASHLPELRELRLEQFEIQWTAMRVCSRLKNLHRVVISKSLYDRDLGTPFAESIFRSCPSLRYIYIRGFGVFTCHPFTREVLHSYDWSSLKGPRNVFHSESSDILY